MAGPPKGYQQKITNRCVHIKRDGTRCRRAAQIGLDRCSTPGHGGTLPNAKAKAAAARIEAKLARKGYGNTPVGQDHEGANPVTGMAWQLRDTAGNIVFLAEKIAELRDEDIIWGRTLEESKNAMGVGEHDDTYDLTRDEARVNLWVGLQLKERQHYATLCKIALAAGFEDRRVRLMETQVLSINDAISNIVSALGFDPHAAEIRAVVRDELLKLVPPALEA